VRVLTDHRLAASMGERGREWVRAEFDPRRVWDALASNYEVWLD
jgi:hypothetical protein